MEWDSDEGIVKSWAENIRRLRSRTISIPREGDPERAIQSAVHLAKDCDLIVRWGRLENILDRVAQSFGTVLGIGAGFLAYAGTASHVAMLAAHLGVEGVVKPYAEAAAGAIYEAVTGSTLYIRRAAETGAQRVFAVTKEDLRGGSRRPQP